MCRGGSHAEGKCADVRRQEPRETEPLEQSRGGVVVPWGPQPRAEVRGRREGHGLPAGPRRPHAHFEAEGDRALLEQMRNIFCPFGSFPVSRCGKGARERGSPCPSAGTFGAQRGAALPTPRVLWPAVQPVWPPPLVPPRARACPIPHGWRWPPPRLWPSRAGRWREPPGLCVARATPRGQVLGTGAACSARGQCGCKASAHSAREDALATGRVGPELRRKLSRDSLFSRV